MLNDTYLFFIFFWVFLPKVKGFYVFFHLIKLWLFYFLCSYSLSTDFISQTFLLCGFCLSNFSFQKSTFANGSRILNGYFSLLLFNCYSIFLLFLSQWSRVLIKSERELSMVRESILKVKSKLKFQSFLEPFS